jgi:hypothetical protein
MLAPWPPVERFCHHCSLLSVTRLTNYCTFQTLHDQFWHFFNIWFLKNHNIYIFRVMGLLLLVRCLSPPKSAGLDPQKFRFFFSKRCIKKFYCFSLFFCVSKQILNFFSLFFKKNCRSASKLIIRLTECFRRCSLSCCLVLQVKEHSGQGYGRSPP